MNQTEDTSVPKREPQLFTFKILLGKLFKLLYTITQIFVKSICQMSGSHSISKSLSAAYAKCIQKKKQLLF